MASTLALGPVMTAVLAALRASVSLTGYVGVRVYPDDDGDVPTKPTYPYVQAESINEVPWNTFGAVTDAHFGSIARFQVRVGSQSRSDAQANTIASLVKQVLDTQTITVTGYTNASVEYVDLQTLRDMQGGITTREWLLTFEAWVKQ